MTGSDLAMAAVYYVCLLLSLSFHEAAHSFVADRCGDPTGRLMGRSSLNPIAHIDPVGTVLLPIIMLFSGSEFLFGWAKPVPFNPRNLRNIRRDSALIGLAGPASNLLLVIVFATVLRLVVGIQNIPFPSSEMPLDAIRIQYPLFALSLMMVVVNAALMLFNLIPIPPLDGGHLLHGLLPRQGQEVLDRIGPFGILIAILIARPLLAYPFFLLQMGVFFYAYWGRI